MDDETSGQIESKEIEEILNEEKKVDELPRPIHGEHGGWDSLGFDQGGNAEVPRLIIQTGRRVHEFRRSIEDLNVFLGITRENHRVTVEENPSRRMKTERARSPKFHHMDEVQQPKNHRKEKHLPKLKKVKGEKKRTSPLVQSQPLTQIRPISAPELRANKDAGRFGGPLREHKEEQQLEERCPLLPVKLTPFDQEVPQIEGLENSQTPSILGAEQDNGDRTRAFSEGAVPLSSAPLQLSKLMRERSSSSCDSSRSLNALVSVPLLPEGKSVQKLRKSLEENTRVTMSSYHEAARAGHVETVQEWMKQGGEVDVRDQRNGFTALHYACKFGQVDVANYLMQEAGANTLLCDKRKGRTAIQHALWKGTIKDLSMIKMCIEHAAVANTPSKEASPTASYTEFSENSKILHRRSLVAHYLTDVRRRGALTATATDCYYVKAEEFILAGKLLPFEYWKDNGLLTPGSKMSEVSMILFVSHRWQEKENPDPCNKHFEQTRKFLKCHKNIDFVWIDYSCITQNRDSDDFGLQLANMVTVLFQATHFLILPQLSCIKSSKIDATHISKYQIQGIVITDLHDYLARAWCRFEALVGLMLGCSCYCHFFFGEKVQTFIKLPTRTDIHDASGLLANDWYSTFEEAAVFSLPNYLSSDEKMALWEGVLREYWRVDYDMDVTYTLNSMLGLFHPSCGTGSCHVIPKDPKLILKALKMGLSPEDLKHSRRLRSTAKRLGKLSYEEDRVFIIQNLLLIFAYATNMLASVYTDEVGVKSKSKSVCCTVM